MMHNRYSGTTMQTMAGMGCIAQLRDYGGHFPYKTVTFRAAALATVSIQGETSHMKINISVDLSAV
jgi:hypothetical protein